MMNRHHRTIARLLNTFASLAALALLTACGSGDPDSEPTLSSFGVQPSKQIKAVQGFSAVFSAGAGAPDKTYQWQRNRIDIPGADQAVYVIPAVSLSDDGHAFVCVISDGDGSVKSEPVVLTVYRRGDFDRDGDIDRDDVMFLNQYLRQPADVFPEGDIDGDGQITVLDARKLVLLCDCARCICPVPGPQITDHPDDVSVAEGEQAVFAVSATGTDLNYQWQKNGTDIPGATESSYALTATLADDRMTFRCIVSNPGGSIQSDAAVLRVLPAGPSILSHPQDKTVVEGETVSFTVAASGAGLSYLWQKDEVDIPQATEATYEFEATYADNGSRYRCIVSNSTGSIESNAAMLTVTVAIPVINTHPVDRTVDEGEAVSFSVDASGNYLSYQWLRNGVNIPGANAATFESTATLADNGADFHCLVTNPGGSAASDPAKLTVLAVAPVVTNHPVSVSVNEGDTASFSVSATGSNLSYQWQKEAVDIPLANSSSYEFEAVYTDHGASYRCIVSNPAGSVVSEAALLTVSVIEPSITVHPIDVTAEAGQTAGFNVVATGNYLSYQWFKDGVEIDGATSSSYSFPASIAHNGASYSCVVSNPGGSVETNVATLTVSVVAPTIVAHPANETVIEGQTATFSVFANGSDLSYQWQKDEVDIPQANQSTYQFEATYADNGTSYRCVISNSAGSLVSSAAVLTVTVEGPVISQQPTGVTVNEGQAAEFTVSATGNHLTYQWQRNNVDIVDATSATYQLTTALADDGAVFRCVVSNPGGTVESEAVVLTVLSNLPEITSQPTDAVVDQGGQASFSVTASGSDSIFQWQKNETDIPGATQATFSIASADLTDHGAYRCRVSNSAGAVYSDSAQLTVNMVIPENPLTVTNPGAEWDQGHARLSWEPLSDVQVRIYRGSSPDDTPMLTDSQVQPFIDTQSDYFLTYYYRLATVKVYTHPVTGEVARAVGPQSAVIPLEALPVPRIRLPGAVQGPGGIFSLACGPLPPYTVNGTYEALADPVTVAASQESTPATGAGANRSFSIQLDAAGVWELRIAEQSGWKQASVLLELQVDDKAPDLTVDGADQRETVQAFAILSGTAIDGDSGLQSVAIVSDRYPGSPFSALVEPSGQYSGEIPLRVGQNLLSVVAADRVGNESHKNVTILLNPPPLPILSITSPLNGSSLNTDRVDVTGIVQSSLAPEEIRLVLNEQVGFPSGSGGEYTFEFENVPLVQGANTITVTAETAYGPVSAQTIISYVVDGAVVAETPPEIEIRAPLPNTFVAGESIIVSGIARSNNGIDLIEVNNQSAQITGTGNTVSFESELLFTGAAEEELQIEVVATDSQSLSTALTFSIWRDTLPPEIGLTSPGILTPPAVTSVLSSPFALTGTITENHLAGLTINDQDVGVLPGGVAGTFSFNAGIALERATDTILSIVARDLAGNSTSREVLLRLEADLVIEIISPQEAANLLASGDRISVDISVRVPGMAATDQIVAQIDGGVPATLVKSGDLARGSIAMPAADGVHQLSVSVNNAAGETVASRQGTFSITNTDNLPLALTRLDPENGDADVEPNTFIGMYFNKPIDPNRLQVLVDETVHGQIYAPSEKGADITKQSTIRLVEVHRDHEAVPGGMAWFPGDTMAAFYPARDFAYSGTVYLTINYDGSELARASFTVRSLPTLIQGFVADQFMQPVEGLEVRLTEADRSDQTDTNGSYGFGFGEPANRMIPPGRYRAVVNAGLKNRSFGSVEQLIRVVEGQLNTVGIIKVPVLNPEEPFRPIAGGIEDVLLAGGDLVLNLKDAQLSFPDGRNSGEVHVQFMNLNEIPYTTRPSAVPHWVFAVQPMGVEVTGTIALEIVMPSLYGGHDYVEQIGDRVILVGFDPNAYQLVPAGVGLVDKDNKRVVSEGPVGLQRLDYIGYALVDEEAQPILKRFADGDISLVQMIGELETEE